MAPKDGKELVDKINDAFFNELLQTWNQCQDKIIKMWKMYCKEHEACNVIGAPPSWSWYECFHNILGGTTKVNGAIGGID